MKEHERTCTLKVRFQSIFAEVFGLSYMEIEVPCGLSLKGALKMLLTRFERDVSATLFDSNENIRPSVMIVLDQRLVATHQINKIILSRACAIDVIPVAAGG